jgi:bacterial/archaeal transporter family-2 protein
MHPLTARPASVLIATSALVVVGMLVAIQARANGDLAERLGGGFSGGAQTALVSFLIGLAVATMWVFAVPAQRRHLASLPAAVSRGALAPWHCLAGLGGAFLILSQSATVPSLGVAVFTVAVVAGQTGGSLAIDQFGLGPGSPSPVTRRRALAALVALGAVVLTVAGRSGPAGFSPAMLMCVAAGLAVSGQSALNGRIGQAVGSSMVAAWTNFAVASVALGLVVAALVAAGHPLVALPSTWWLYTGGPLGLAFVSVVAAAVRVVNVLLVSLATVAGQVVGAVLLDAFAPAPGQSLRVQTVVGTVVTVVAVVMAMEPRWRPRTARQT